MTCEKTTDTLEKTCTYDRNIRRNVQFCGLMTKRLVSFLFLSIFFILALFFVKIINISYKQVKSN